MASYCINCSEVKVGPYDSVCDNCLSTHVDKAIDDRITMVVNKSFEHGLPAPQMLNMLNDVEMLILCKRYEKQLNDLTEARDLRLDLYKLDEHGTVVLNK